MGGEENAVFVACTFWPLTLPHRTRKELGTPFICDLELRLEWIATRLLKDALKVDRGNKAALSIPSQ